MQVDNMYVNLTIFSEAPWSPDHGPRSSSSWCMAAWCDCRTLTKLSPWSILETCQTIAGLRRVSLCSTSFFFHKIKPSAAGWTMEQLKAAISDQMLWDWSKTSNLGQSQNRWDKQHYYPSHTKKRCVPEGRGEQKTFSFPRGTLWVQYIEFAECCLNSATRSHTQRFS